MYVQMLVDTMWDGEKLEPGDTADVTPEVAERWERAGIANVVESKVDPAGKSLDRMNTAELEAKAAELGVNLSGAATNKQRAEAIQAFLDANGNAESGENGEENAESGGGGGDA